MSPWKSSCATWRLAMCSGKVHSTLSLGLEFMLNYLQSPCLVKYTVCCQNWV
jgi:hypothetical protein